MATSKVWNPTPVKAGHKGFQQWDLYCYTCTSTMYYYTITSGLWYFSSSTWFPRVQGKARGRQWHPYRLFSLCLLINISVKSSDKRRWNVSQNLEFYTISKYGKVAWCMITKECKDVIMYALVWLYNTLAWLGSRDTAVKATLCQLCLCNIIYKCALHESIIIVKAKSG